MIIGDVTPLAAFAQNLAVALGPDWVAIDTGWQQKLVGPDDLELTVRPAKGGARRAEVWSFIPRDYGCTLSTSVTVSVDRDIDKVAADLRRRLFPQIEDNKVLAATLIAQQQEHEAKVDATVRVVLESGVGGDDVTNNRGSLHLGANGFGDWQANADNISLNLRWLPPQVAREVLAVLSAHKNDPAL